ncbi:hypothetical protein GCM10010401_02370 [Rarobacter faecitabidus]|uniref:DUF3040 family protein n=1 Tax=Rarobacter faecitabidus TaxID=13243 RepID=A0A542ZW93_RARFA|nr:DUF3040 domain-containing protein [Rarobacter faecitabidus]TQL64627.1 DUF3040 family protein [Rarobacter faecitabidus]
MPLSEYEQRVLDEMERSLRGDSSEPATESSAPRRVRPRKYSVAIAGIIVGLVLVVLGAVQSLVVVGILGFLIMLSATIYGFGRPANSRTEAQGGRGKSETDKARRASTPKASLSERLADRWERRRRGEL